MNKSNIYKMNNFIINNKFKKLLLITLIVITIIISLLLLFDIFYNSLNYIIFKNYNDLNIKIIVFYILIMSIFLIVLFLAFNLIDKKSLYGYLLFIFINILMYYVFKFYYCK